MYANVRGLCRHAQDGFRCFFRLFPDDVLKKAPDDGIVRGSEKSFFPPPENQQHRNTMNDSSFLILFIALTALMAVFPFLLRKYHIPNVIALLVVGMLIGSKGLLGFDLVAVLSKWLSFLGTPGEEAQTAANTAQQFKTFVDSLGSLGLMFLMALAGMEADFHLIRSARKAVAMLSVLTFFIPAVAGYMIYWHFCPDELAGKVLYASLFASHSVGIVFPVIRELKLSHTRFGAAVLISTVITDIASIILLAVSVQLFRQSQNISHMVGRGTLSIFDHMDTHLLGNSFLPVFLLIVLVYLGTMIFITNCFGRWVLSHIKLSDDIVITLLLLMILVTVIVGELFGINLVVGAFIAGLGLARVVRERDQLLFKRFESIGYGFLIPFLFISIGMKTDFSAFFQMGNIVIVLLTVVGLIGSKVGSGFAAMKLSGYSHKASLAAGLMTVPQLSATLAAAAIGKDTGILDDRFFNAIIILSIITTLPIPSLVRAVLNYKRNEFVELSDFQVPNVVKDDELL